MDRVYNFAAGPAALPLPVLETAQKEMLAYGSTGMSVMEMSHRSKMYLEIFERAQSAFRRVMKVPDNYKVLFLQGGATGQFAAVAMNLLKTEADYADTGNFAHGAMVEAQKYGKVNCISSSRDEGYTFIPDITPDMISENADYVHITTNNTIFGTRYTFVPETGKVPLVADMSSNILSEEVDVSKFGVIYAGAQKNIGPAGLTVVVVRDDLPGSARPDCPKLFDWALQVKNDSMLNTPPCYSIYVAGLCFEWLESLGGVKAIEEINKEKSALLYDLIDNSSLYRNNVRKDCRSRMNVPFVTGDPDMDAKFVKEAAANGLVNIKGHRLVGGMRASIYNAMPIEGVRALAEFMKKFEKENA